MRIYSMNNLESFNNCPTELDPSFEVTRPGFEILRELRETGSGPDLNGRPTPFTNFFEHPTGMVIYNLVRAERARNVLELGLAHGVSSIYLLQGVADNGGGRVISMDPGVPADGIGLNNIRRAGLSQYHTFSNQPSEYVLPAIAQSDFRADFIFIDTNHMYDQTIVEAYFANRILRVGGIMMFDDCQLDSVRTACNFVEANLHYQLHPLHTENGGKALEGLSNVFRIMRKMKNDDREWFHFKPFEVQDTGQLGKYLDWMAKNRPNH